MGVDFGVETSQWDFLIMNDLDVRFPESIYLLDVVLFLPRLVESIKFSK